MLAISADAQDAFDAGDISSSDLNGTARFVGMGGALSALGADISTMSTNPAGTGLYRRSEFNMSLSGQFTDEGQLGHDAARLSFDNIGILCAFEMDDSGEGLQYFNFGFNYVKKRNHLANAFVNVSGLNGMFSQTYQIADYANLSNQTDSWGLLTDLACSSSNHGGILYEDNVNNEIVYSGQSAASGQYRRACYGSTSEADFNFSLNFSDKFFFGASLGIYNIDYTRESAYMEVASSADAYAYEIYNWAENSGEGVDLKLGMIFRPFEDSPFRIGFSVHTPTWYRMTLANGATMCYNVDPSNHSYGQSYYLISSDYEYSFRTPWKLDASLGYTIGKNFAIGLEYEMCDMGSARYSSLDDSHYSDDYIYFREVNDIISSTFKTQHTFKVGLEYKPIDDVSVRFGYNHVTSPFCKDGYKRELSYAGYATETDWTYWKAINRFTVGLGFKISSSSYLDFTYMAQFQKGDFYAFNDYYLDEATGVTRYMPSSEIKNDRSQLMATFGVRF